MLWICLVLTCTIFPLTLGECCSLCVWRSPAALLPLFLLPKLLHPVGPALLTWIVLFHADKLSHVSALFWIYPLSLGNPAPRSLWIPFRSAWLVPTALGLEGLGAGHKAGYIFAFHPHIKMLSCPLAFVFLTKLFCT